MDMNQRIIFFDVDRTLVDHGTWSVPASASAALVRLKEAGHRLYINTSRSVNEMKNVADLLAPLGLDGMVLSGGAHTAAPGGKTIRLCCMPSGAPEALLPRMEAMGLSVRWQTEEALYFQEEPPADVLRILMDLFGETPPVLRWSGEPLLRLVTYASPEQVDSLRRAAPGLRFMDQGHQVICVTESGVDKAGAMLAEAYRLGYTREQIVAFGDGLNDCDMLGCAGVGVAMGDAHPVTKAAADYITASAGEDGIYIACRHLGLI